MSGDRSTRLTRAAGLLAIVATTYMALYFALTRGIGLPETAAFRFLFFCFGAIAVVGLWSAWRGPSRDVSVVRVSWVAVPTWIFAALALWAGVSSLLKGAVSAGVTLSIIGAVFSGLGLRVFLRSRAGNDAA